MEILRRLAPGAADPPTKCYHAVFDGELGGIPCIISKTGYTGEDGVELYAPADQAEKLWDLLLETGRDDGLIPCGLGARDTLRMEAAMPLYGHEMNDDVTPLETGRWTAPPKMKTDDFIGKSAMEEAGAPKIKRVGLKVTGRGIIREDQTVYAEDASAPDGRKEIGHTYFRHPLPIPGRTGGHGTDRQRIR